MNSSIKMGRILGIPIYLHLTFLIILALFVYIFTISSDSLFGITIGFGGLDASWGTRFAFGTATSVVFFATVLAHELCHSYVAIRYGVRIKSITLMLFGGMASMEEIPRGPGQELKMSFAGPLSSLIIGVGSYGAMAGLELADSGSVLVEGLAILFGIIAFYNILLAGFNLLPAFPMDGGRMLRSYLATRMPYILATRKAARVGRYAAIAMAIFGLFVVINVFLILIAIFVYLAASEEERATAITESLRGVRVKDVMTKDARTIHPNTSIKQLLDLMLSTKQTGFPVVDGVLLGIVTLSDAQRVPEEKMSFAIVRDVMSRDVVTAHPDADAATALRTMVERNIKVLVVTDQGTVMGVVTSKDLLRAAEIMETIREGSGGDQIPPDQRPRVPPIPPTASS